MPEENHEFDATSSPFLASPGARPFPEDRPLHAVANAIADGTGQCPSRVADTHPDPILFISYLGLVALTGGIVGAEQPKS